MAIVPHYTWEALAAFCKQPSLNNFYLEFVRCVRGLLSLRSLIRSAIPTLLEVARSQYL